MDASCLTPDAPLPDDVPALQALLRQALAELVLPGGAVLRLPTGCDLAWVRSLVAALGDAAC